MVSISKLRHFYSDLSRGLFNSYFKRIRVLGSVAFLGYI